MARAFRVDIVTPDRSLFGGDAESLRATAHEGDLGILAGHAPLLCALRPGVIHLRSGLQPLVYSVSGGFLEVSGGRVVVLADSAEPVSEIDRGRAEESLQRARERLGRREKGLDSARAEASMDRNRNRIRLHERHASGGPNG